MHWAPWQFLFKVSIFVFYIVIQSLMTISRICRNLQNQFFVWAISVCMTRTNYFVNWHQIWQTQKSQTMKNKTWCHCKITWVTICLSYPTERRPNITIIMYVPFTVVRNNLNHKIQVFFRGSGFTRIQFLRRIKYTKKIHLVLDTYTYITTCKYVFNILIKFIKDWPSSEIILT